MQFHGERTDRNLSLTQNVSARVGGHNASFSDLDACVFIARSVRLKVGSKIYPCIYSVIFWHRINFGVWEECNTNKMGHLLVLICVSVLSLGYLQHRKNGKTLNTLRNLIFFNKYFISDCHSVNDYSWVAGSWKIDIRWRIQHVQPNCLAKYD